MFYFAWADNDELTFGPEHHREDEDVFAFSMRHEEGEFPALQIDIRNPRIGLLATGRKQWAWLSWKDPANVVHPLFYGRIVAVPQNIVEDIVRLSFVARPVDYEEQLDALADSMRVSPYYDPMWLSEADRMDPDRVLEGYPKLWHVDRVTHVVTASDIIVPEDGQVNFGQGDAFYDSVKTTFSSSPARRAIVNAEVNWLQQGSGTVDLTSKLIKAFADKTPANLTTVSGSPRPSAGMLNVLGGDEAMSNWPQPLDDIGGGWFVGADTVATLVGPVPIVPANIGSESNIWGSMRQWPNLQWGVANVMREIFERTPGFLVEIKDNSKAYQNAIWGNYSGNIDVMWVPIWRLGVKFTMGFAAERERTEHISFQVDADVQPLLTDAGEEETIRLDFGPVDCDLFIGKLSRNKFFATDRGHDAFGYLLACTRASLLARARAVDVSFEVPFEKLVNMSLRKGASIQDPRLPDGIAAGKVKVYELAAQDGELMGGITLGCTVGRDGSIVANLGTPQYVETGYVSNPYQEMADEVLVPIPGAIGFTMDNYSLDDDGVNLDAITVQKYLTSLEVFGALEEQMAEAQSAPASSAADGMADIVGFKTDVRLTMKPVTGGPFFTTIQPTVTALKVPRTLNLETT